jgi:hypothetical protein
MTSEMRKRISDSVKKTFLERGIAEKRRGISLSEETKRKISLANKGKGKGKIVSEETRKKLSEATKRQMAANPNRYWLGKKRSPESIAKRVAKMKGISHTAEHNRKIGEGNKGKFVSLETRKKISKWHTGFVFSEESKRKMSESQKGKKHSERTKKKRRLSLKRAWANKSVEERDKWVYAIHANLAIRPNKPETAILNILNSLYPGEWKYVGDGEVVIAGKIPDFINVNGQKKIIELFGDYWHEGQDPKDRIKVFKPFGYKTLVIWERELNEIEKVEKRIKAFNNL